MDLNHILLFVAAISALILIARSQRHAEVNRGWRTASVALLLVTGGAGFFFPAIGGYIAGGAWLVLLLVPALGARYVADLLLRQHFTAARRLAQLLALLHPADGIPEEARLARALELAQHDSTQAALAQLARLRSNATALGRQATAQTFAILGDWHGLIAWCHREIQPPVFARDAGIAVLYLQALGETHAVNELVLQFAARVQTISDQALTRQAVQFSLLTLLAFCGRTGSLVRIMKESRPKLSEETRAFWIATSEIAAGEIAAGRARFEQLRLQTRDALLRARIKQRLQSASEYACAAASCSGEGKRVLHRLEAHQWNAIPLTTQRVRATPVVLTLIALNIAMFALETILGGSENPITLHRLGQLETSAFFANQEYWRLLTALFLHYGYLHLLFNVYALFVLGPALEKSIGALRFVACYLLSGIGAGLGVVALHAAGLTPAEEIVGASGSIMGVVGAWAGLLLKNRHAPFANRRLQSILVIVLIQTAFDLSTPQVSMGAHMSGLASGLILGLLLAPHDLRA